MAERTGVTVRPAEVRDEGAWIAMRDALWPGSPEDHAAEVPVYFRSRPPGEICLVAEVGRGRLLGFAELRLREYAEDCRTSPVGYLEGIFVVPEARRSGVGAALVRAGEAWARTRGCTEMASDRELDNVVSGAFHEEAGYVETVRMVCYRKDL